MEKKVLQNMFDHLLHIGNKTNYWNPRMREYIYGSTNGVHVINLVKTHEQIEEVKSMLEKLTKEGKSILFVATKLQARDPFVALAESTGNFYVTEKWVPGLLTNFKTMKKRISTYVKLLKDSESGAFDVLTKKEIASKMLELEKLDKAFKGLKNIKKLPDIVFVVDGEYESQAIKEANTLGLTCISVSNTNGDPLRVDAIIPANTNSVKSLQYIADEIKPSIKAYVEKSGGVRKQRGQKVSGARNSRKPGTTRKPALDNKEAVTKTQATDSKKESKTTEK